MRVRISYSVELEDVPQEVVRLLETANNQVTDVRDSIDELVAEIENDASSADRIAKIISDLRESLAKIDHQLADSDSIIQGYYQATTPPEITGDKDSVSEG